MRGFCPLSGKCLYRNLQPKGKFTLLKIHHNREEFPKNIFYVKKKKAITASIPNPINNEWSVLLARGSPGSRTWAPWWSWRSRSGRPLKCDWPELPLKSPSRAEKQKKISLRDSSALCDTHEMFPHSVWTHGFNLSHDGRVDLRAGDPNQPGTKTYHEMIVSPTQKCQSPTRWSCRKRWWWWWGVLHLCRSWGPTPPRRRHRSRPKPWNPSWNERLGAPDAEVSRCFSEGFYSPLILQKTRRVMWSRENRIYTPHLFVKHQELQVSQPLLRIL